MSPVEYQFNPFALPPLVTAVPLVLIAAWVLIRERASPVSRAFAATACVVFVWQITKALTYLSATPETATAWARLGYLGIPFIGPAMYYFSTHLLGVSGKRRVVSAAGWAIGAAFCVAALSTDLLVVGVRRYFWGFYPAYGGLGALFLPFFGAMMGLALREFYIQYREAGPGVYRRRIRALLIAFAIANTGALDYLAAYGIEFYPIGYLSVFGFLMLAAWAVVRYRLVDLTPSFAAEQILSTMADPLIVLDSERRIRAVNDATCQVFGYERGELISRPVKLLAGGDEAAREKIRAMCTSQGVRDEEMVLFTRDAAPVQVSISTSHVDDEGGATVGTVLIARDIRERKEVERALRDSEERFRALIQNISDVIVLLGGDLSIRFVSASARRVLGYLPEEQIGRPALDLVHPDDLERVQAELAAIGEPGSTAKGEARVRHADGSWRIVEATATNLLHDPAVRGIIIAYKDVTERKAAEAALRESEEQLRHSQRMEAVGRLAGGVAHDFNNLLTVINGEVLLLLESPPADPEMRVALEEVLRAGNRAGDLTRQLLAFSRRQVLQPKMLDLNVVLTDLEKLLRRLIGADIELGVALEPNLGKVKADPGQIEQVILNLVVNARDAMPRGGVLQLETRNVPAADLPAGLRESERGYVSISVRDNGIGMDEETLSRVFEPFFTTKELGKGTGLGLSTVYGIVEQSGGTVFAESTPGVGTLFRILLPRAEEEAAAAPRSGGVTGSAGGTETILLVEDEGSVRVLTQTILQRCGYTVLSARNGTHALGVAGEAKRVDLLLTDVVMPGMGGRELAETLLAKHPGLKVLYMSGYTDDAVLRHGVEGGTAFLPKPFTPVELAQKVRQMLDAPALPPHDPEAAAA